MEGCLGLTQRDRDRLVEIRAVIRGQLRSGQAARRLGLTSRQVRRLVWKVREQGDRGVVHGLRGRASNRRISDEVRRRAVAFVSRPKYRDFAPTLAAEHLGREGIEVSRETLRKWMSGAGLWRPHHQRIERIHTWRERRAAFGELVLMDSSDHNWLEGRGPRLWLVAMIDDATDRLVGRFVYHDTTSENLRTLKQWLVSYGRPLALYTDRDSIFVTTRPYVTEQVHGPAPPTSFAECLEELDIEWIAAYSPQAKGRVERVFETLQDRLVKEMRVAGVSTREDANRFFNEVFLSQYERFTHAPREAKDAHRSMKRFDLDSVLSLRDTRLVTADYTLSLNGQRWAIGKRDVVPGLRLSRVTVETRLDGTRWVRFKTQRLPLSATTAAAAPNPSGLRSPGPATDSRPLPKGKWRPPKDHPWRKQIHTQATAQLAKRTFLLGGKADISTLP